jgi:hypothetical protein
MKCVWIVERKEQKGGKWLPFDSFITKKLAQDGLAAFDGFVSGWFRIVKYVSMKKL